MRSSEDLTADLVARDPALPLGLVLDEGALSGWLAERTGVVGTARRRYLRYKPRSSVTALVDWHSPTGSEPLVVNAWAAASTPKLAKTVAHAPQGSLVTIDHRQRVLVSTPAADRHVPALSALAAPHHRAVADLLGRCPRPLTTLAYKPHRRWVGRLPAEDHPAAATLLLRAYRRGRAHRPWQLLELLAQTQVAATRPLAYHRRLDLIVGSWATGTPMDALVAADPTSNQIAEVGTLLARLHTAQPPLIQPRFGAGWIPHASGPDSLAEAVASLSTLDPELATRTTALVERLTAALAPTPASDQSTALIHGDFSLDQVVATHAGPVLLDLDRASIGDPAADLGSTLAVLYGEPHTRLMAADLLQQLLTGYAQQAPLPPLARIAVHAADQLLRRAVEPFRHGESQWRRAIAIALSTAEQLLDEGDIIRPRRSLTRGASR
ncbi:MAG: aminoglycoside phosphotransferase family protein [Propioniciclava sp.]